MGIEEILARYHEAADEFSRGNPVPVKDLLSRGDDVTLANPFGPAVRGWSAVSAALEFASSRFREGTVTAFAPMAVYATTDLATILEIEHWTAKVGEREEATSFGLRVTSTFRRESRRLEAGASTRGSDRYTRRRRSFAPSMTRR